MGGIGVPRVDDDFALDDGARACLWRGPSRTGCGRNTRANASWDASRTRSAVRARTGFGAGAGCGPAGLHGAYGDPLVGHAPVHGPVCVAVRITARDAIEDRPGTGSVLLVLPR
ncbi:hypothetical protein GCM10017687_82340 [Streptomyces echinatus]